MSEDNVFEEGVFQADSFQISQEENPPDSLLLFTLGLAMDLGMKVK